MKLIFVYSISLLCLMTCSSGNQKPATQLERKDNFIHLSAAIENAREEMLLSELVDSISYI